MNVKEIIYAFIKKNEEINRSLTDLKLSEDNSDDIIKRFAENLLKHDFNSSLGYYYLLLLQLDNEKEIIKQYELEDIRLLFNSLLKIQKDNLNLYVEQGNFEWAVMDNKANAEKILEEGLEIAKKRVEELTNLLTDIKEK
ncbi:hypothetical protein [Pedobacter agri]|uniref:Uncharacterized protein n=1 Tax=Pedobacter agri TaxID=454586 RepID=A0A9X3DI21_9SPHI|nr:hypothetical protein [Pedobacter agri]MCX3267496.1 hypothetical protein [Pedobacter agri]